MIDDDVSRGLRRLEKTTHRTLKEVVNDILRKGLAAGARPLHKPPRFRVKARHSGFLPGIDPLKLNQLADELQTGDFVRRAARRKPS
jgi:hypothetical protein